MTGSFNTGVGAGTLLLNVGDPSSGDGTQNTAIGAGALLSNTTGDGNTSNGAFALFSNTIGFENTVTGWQALYSNTTGFVNAATGVAALTSNTTGHHNTATGNTALWLNTEDYRNTATGFAALQMSTTGNFNTAHGWASLLYNETGSLNTALGAAAGSGLTSGGNNVYIGNVGITAEDNTIRIGTVVEVTDPFSPNLVHPVHTATYIAGITGQTASGGVAVYINSDGKLGTLTSSARFKTDIKPMDNASEAILALKPVTFRYKQEIDNKGIPQFGLIAEDVEKVNPDPIARDREGKPYSVRYEAVNAMLLNEFLKAHRKIDNLETLTVKQEQQIGTLTAQLKDQAAQIQKVNDKLDLRQRASQLVVAGE